MSFYAINLDVEFVFASYLHKKKKMCLLAVYFNIQSNVQNED
jgi:hypothetical protein